MGSGLFWPSGSLKYSLLSNPASLPLQNLTSFWQEEQKQPSAFRRWERPRRTPTTPSLKLRLEPAKLTAVVKLPRHQLRTGTFGVEGHIWRGDHSPYLAVCAALYFCFFLLIRSCLFSGGAEVFTWRCYEGLCMCGMQTFAHFIWLHSCCWEGVLFQKTTFATWIMYYIAVLYIYIYW